MVRTVDEAQWQQILLERLRAIESKAAREAALAIQADPAKRQRFMEAARKYRDAERRVGTWKDASSQWRTLALEAHSVGSSAGALGLALAGLGPVARAVMPPDLERRLADIAALHYELKAIAPRVSRLVSECEATGKAAAKSANGDVEDGVLRAFVATLAGLFGGWKRGTRAHVLAIARATEEARCLIRGIRPGSKGWPGDRWGVRPVEFVRIRPSE